ncbi:hypothetical protein INR75_06570 [Zunongwangia sp. SCSIO 43204]|uniref:hypothetical protein n=1 Tax=Zunongwangia sp. SCSIO 43204 TaxID=2779359 RepID=UPI001CA8A7DC|nr:hypothetical protein [Zunongwangia sp. SCSIO 43204]UAB85672.1 hypothetical protein INR75_06570 [Zunongwangia sp. SCSIO 43204]
MIKEVILGENIKKHIPANRLEDVKLSFQNHNLDFENDLHFCDLQISNRGTCWLHDTRNKRFNWNGTLIATFHFDGSSFYFTNSNRGDERLKKYKNKRHEFFKVKRTAREIGEFEKTNFKS